MSKSSTIIKAGANRLAPVHPGAVLRDELEARDLSASALARAIGVPVTRVTDVLNARRGITADTALRLARYFGGSANFWLNLQQSYDLKVAEASIGKTILKRIAPAAA
ncbi:MAG: HigA family addiction module antidote protein [Rhodospirillaceae bacterium]|nr:HigA family addiction module antidote protein [Rhodospirillaceae bacterium]